MNAVFDLVMSNIYLYICILIVLVIVATILSILASNQKNRRKIKDDFVEAEKVETEMENAEKEYNELEEIIQKMQDDINVKPEDVVKKFEEEQEEKAIISYKELVDNVNSGKIEVVDDEEGNTNYVEALNVDNDIGMVKTNPIVEDSVTPEMVKDVIKNIYTSSVKEEPKKFKNSEFISPIFGVMKEELDYPRVKKTQTTLDIMNTREYNELSEEIRKQEEFLEALKEFRNNL